MMDVLEKITALRLGRHWSEYQLAERSGLTQSTISSWYRKNLIPSIPSLERICDAFGITLSQFFLEDNAAPTLLTPEQAALINASNKLSSEQFSALLNFINTLN
ncbi:MAG: helix-turn-helix domain-containing protein [Lachnospiraceae bacterium]|nr:helix-turn-helix domain-containing protein [Lachnospiraceae bacterium]